NPDPVDQVFLSACYPYAVPGNNHPEWARVHVEGAKHDIVTGSYLRHGVSVARISGTIVSNPHVRAIKGDTPGRVEDMENMNQGAVAGSQFDHNTAGFTGGICDPDVATVEGKRQWIRSSIE